MEGHLAQGDVWFLNHWSATFSKRWGPRIVDEDGNIACSECKRMLPVSMFHATKKNGIPLHSWCKECSVVKSRVYDKQRAERSKKFAPTPISRKFNPLNDTQRQTRDLLADCDVLVARLQSMRTQFANRANWSDAEREVLTRQIEALREKFNSELSGISEAVGRGLKRVS